MSTKPKLTAEHFYKFFQCPHWLWYDLYGEPGKKNEQPPLLQMIYQDGLHHETKLKLLGSRPSTAGRQFKEIDPNLFKDLDEAFLATLELMKKGENIYHGVLMDEHWVGMPDLLVARPVKELGLPAAEIAHAFGKPGRVSEGSREGFQHKNNIGTGAFGEHYYVAYDIKSSGELKDETKFQLVFYSLILERLQGIRPREAYLINAYGEETAFVVDEFLQQFDLNLSQIEKILDGQKPPPFLKSGCKRTPWYNLCVEEVEGCRDVSLVYRLSQSDQRQLYDIGIRTIDDFARSDLEVVRTQLESWNFDKLLRFYNQAQALIKNEPVIMQNSNFAEAPTEIYFDIESDPTHGLVYLLGVLVKKTAASAKSSGVPMEYLHWFAEGADGERAIWEQFTAWLAEQPNDVVIYHYANYERQMFDRLAQKYGVKFEIADKFRSRTVDLLRSVTDAVILPIYFYSLKDVARYVGYTWEAEDAGGAESVLWYDEWLTAGDNKLKEKIIRYNEDDVRATLAVKEWLAKQKPKTTREEMRLPE